jgi:hypothetical protein
MTPAPKPLHEMIEEVRDDRKAYDKKSQAFADAGCLDGTEALPRNFASRLR